VQDIDNANEISYHEELITYYEKEFLPDLLKDHFFRFGWLLDDKNKVEYLRSEYKRFLNETKKEILTSHFRHNRIFKPRELKLSLLRHKLYSILPYYAYFKHQMDEPTKAVAGFLKTKIQHLPEETEQLLAKKYETLKQFNHKTSKKYYGEMKDGWHVVFGQLTDEEEREHRLMSLLLLDSEKDGC
jgi:hypothetical protein